MSNPYNNSGILLPGHDTAFGAGWQNFGGVSAPAAYWKDNDGIVHARGMVTGGPANSAIFIVGRGLRPAAQERFSCAAYPGMIAGMPPNMIPAGIPVFAADTGTDSHGDTFGVAVSGRTTEAVPVNSQLNSDGTVIAPNPVVFYGQTWVDVNPDGTVVAWQPCQFPGYFISLSGIQFLAEK